MPIFLICMMKVEQDFKSMLSVLKAIAKLCFPSYMSISKSKEILLNSLVQSNLLKKKVIP